MLTLKSISYLFEIQCNSNVTRCCVFYVDSPAHLLGLDFDRFLNNSLSLFVFILPNSLPLLLPLCLGKPL